MYNYNNEPTTIKEAAIKFDIFIRDGGVGSSMFFVLMMLIIVNTHSLHFLFGDGILNWVFAIFSAIGFSIATTAVIRKPVAEWMKYLFPVFDMFLVFLGFNLLNNNIPVHFIMTLLFSAFTGAILIGLGTINYNENTKEAEETNFKRQISELEIKVTNLKSKITEKEFQNNKLQTDNNELKELRTKFRIVNSNYLSELEKVHLLNSEINELKDTYNLLLNNCTKYQTDTESKFSDFDKMKTDLAEKETLLADYKFQITELDKYKRGYLFAEKSRILKKKVENRTEEEVELLNEIENLK
ncbi:MAG: hypothetical protein JXA16_00955 [Bacteroidales bacterium]|nr:hypothetical protein [Bacteroidales bacterium]